MTETFEPPMKTEEKPNNTSPQRNHKLIWLTLILVLCGIGWLLLWLFYFQFHASTDDAYVNGNKVNVTSVIPGMPIAYYADDTDLVEEGQLLILLDSTEYQIAYDKALASLTATVLKVKQLYDNIKVSTAAVQAKRIAFEKARYDFENRRGLIETKAISNEEFIHSKDSYNTAEQELKQSVFQLQMAQDAVGKYSLEKHPQIEEQKAAVRDAFYKLKHCSIYAPATGYVAQRAVEVGQWVTSSTYMMAIIPSDYMWIDANYKETQLTSMRIGQPAKVTIDIYDGEVFEGKVFGIASGTGSVFSLIPPQNATGNWIKIVQRLPVRIFIDKEKLKKYPLRLGLSAVVDVDITNTDLPLMAQNPPTKPVATTSVYQINMEEVEKTMDTIITDNVHSIMLDSR